jgi:hypothetical protein
MASKEYFLNRLNQGCQWTNKGFIHSGIPCPPTEINKTFNKFEEEHGYHFNVQFIGDKSKDCNENFLKHVNDVIKWGEEGFTSEDGIHTYDEITDLLNELEESLGYRARPIFVDINEVPYQDGTSEDDDDSEQSYNETSDHNSMCDDGDYNYQKVDKNIRDKNIINLSSSPDKTVFFAQFVIACLLIRVT